MSESDELLEKRLLNILKRFIRVNDCALTDVGFVRAVYDRYVLDWEDNCTGGAS